jgi:predicted O-methyltransferase YrrM
MTQYPNWFNEGMAVQYFNQTLREFVGQPVTMLQIGAYTGDASEWLLNHVLTNPESRLVDVDTWKGSDEIAHKNFDWSDVESFYTKRFESQLAEGKLIKIKSTSAEYFANHDTMYDFIYVDGDHTGIGVLADGMDAYDCLKVGGILAFDDYGWNPDNLPRHLTPAPAINAIREIYVDRLEVIADGYQVWFRKIS